MANNIQGGNTQYSLGQISGNWNNGNYGNTNVSNNGNVWGGFGNVFGFNRVTTGPDTRVSFGELAKANSVGKNASITDMMNSEQAFYDTLKANKLDKNNYAISYDSNGNATISQRFQNEDGSYSWKNVNGNDIAYGSDGTSINWNFGQMMGGIQNLANMGLGVGNAIMGWNQYKQNKELLKKQQQLLEQQIEQNQENMEYTRKERARQDTMRSNVSAQRSSSSNVRSF